MIRIRNACSLFVLGWLLASSASAAPAIVIPQPSFDFGKAPQFATLSHVFWIKSVGDQTLRITQVVPGCGCTKAPLKDSVLAPGDSTSIEIIFSTISFRGLVTKKPYLETNVSDEKSYLTITAELEPQPEEMMPVRLEPSRLDVSQFTSTPRRRAQFQMQNKTDKAYQIVPVDTSMKSFEVTLPGKIGAGETVEGTVAVREDAVKTQFEQSFSFDVLGADTTRYTLPVKRKYRPLKEK